MNDPGAEALAEEFDMWVLAEEVGVAANDEWESGYRSALRYAANRLRQLGGPGSEPA